MLIACLSSLVHSVHVHFERIFPAILGLDSIRGRMPEPCVIHASGSSRRRIADDAQPAVDTYHERRITSLG